MTENTNKKGKKSFIKLTPRDEGLNGPAGERQRLDGAFLDGDEQLTAGLEKWFSSSPTLRTK
jgi:hypothetical protein